MASPTSRHQMSEEMQQCITDGLNCNSVCLETLTYCLQKGGKHADATHVQLLLDCSEVCQTSANFMLRDSQLHGLLCGVCAEVCDRCATSCEQLGDDAQMKACAEACRRAALSCRKMSGASM